MIWNQTYIYLGTISDDVSSQRGSRSLSSLSDDTVGSLAHSVSNVVIDGSVLDDIQSLSAGSTFGLQLGNQILIDSGGSLVGSDLLVQISLVSSSIELSLLDVLSGVDDLLLGSGEFLLGRLELSAEGSDVVSGLGDISLEVGLGALFVGSLGLLGSAQIGLDLSQEGEDLLEGSGVSESFSGHLEEGLDE